MRFEGRHLYRGVVDGVTEDHSSEYEYWVLSELRRAPYVAKEYVSGDLGKAPTWNVRHTGTRDFTHVVIPAGFGEHSLVVCWIVSLCVLWVGCVAALVFDASSLVKNRFNGEDEKLLVMPTALSHALRIMGFAGQSAGVLFSGAAIVLFATLFWRHHEDKQITWEVMGVWVKTEALFRLTIFFSSFRAVSFFRELPKPHHFARGNLAAMLALLGLLAYALATKPVARFRSLSQLFAADSLLSLQTIDAVTLPLVMGISVFFRAKVISDVVRQQHFVNLHTAFVSATATTPPTAVSDVDEAASNPSTTSHADAFAMDATINLAFDDDHETEDSVAQDSKSEGWVPVFTAWVVSYVGAKGWLWWATVCVAFIGQMLLYTVAVLVLFRAVLFVPAPGLVVEFGPGTGGNGAAADNTKWFKTAASMWT